MIGEEGRRARQPADGHASSGALVRQARHSAPISRFCAMRRAGEASGSGKRARPRLSPFRPRRANAGGGGAGHDRAARRPFPAGSPGARRCSRQRWRRAASPDRALAFDRPDVAAAVLARSPVLTDADLVDCVAAADVVAQSALARRPDLKPGAIAALAETAQREALLALIGNREAALAAGALTRIFARFGADPEVRERCSSVRRCRRA